MLNNRILNPSVILSKIDTLFCELTISASPEIKSSPEAVVNITKPSVFSKILNNLGCKPKVLRPNQITDVSDKSFFNYCVQFRDALISKDIFLFHELFKNSLGNEHLYVVSGYPFDL